MKVIVFADRLGQELAPLTDKTCVALLPIAGKSVLVHTIENLTMAGLHEIIFVISAYADQVEAVLGTGKRWGAQFQYILSRGEENPADILQRLELVTGESYLLLRGDILRSSVIHSFLKSAETLSNHHILGVIDNAPCAILYLCRDVYNPSLLAYLSWGDKKDLSVANDIHQIQLIDHVHLSYLDSLRSYHQTNLDVIAGRFEGPIIPGKQAGLGLTTGRGSQISIKSLKKGLAFIGTNCRIHREAELLDEVVINDNVIIDKGVTVRSSVILPNTYIGELVEIKNAIVWSNTLIRVDTGAVLHVTEAFLLADLRTQTLTNNLAGPLHRLLGFMLIIFSLPLWLLALLATSLNSSRLQTEELLGNQTEIDDMGQSQRKKFKIAYWNTSIPILRYLPRLWATVTGDLRVVGTLPLTPVQSSQHSEEWEQVRDEAPVGLIGPTLLNLPYNAPIEEKLMSDAFYARQRSTLKDLGYLWLGVCILFSKRAWQSHRSN